MDYEGKVQMWTVWGHTARETELVEMKIRRRYYQRGSLS